jgi:hypothetical protein
MSIKKTPMIKYLVETVLSLQLIFILVSCGNCPCIPADLNISFAGFSDAECDTLVLKKFRKGSNYNNQQDSILLTGIVFNRSNDTLKMVAFPGNAVLESRYDYQLEIPAINRQFRIGDINEIQEEQHCGIFNTNKVACINSITSYKVDGKLFSGQQNYTEIFISK